MRATGLAAIAVLLAVPLLWWPALAAQHDWVALFSQYLGLWALIAMAVAQLLATRWPGVETVFGPMDRSYRLHKYLGIGALLSLLVHDTVDAEMPALGGQSLLEEAAETAGEIGLYGLLILVVITVATFVPYHLWKWSHRAIGGFFVLGAFHYLFILKPFANGDPLGLYMAAVCAVGIAAFVYTALPRGMRPAHSYRIAHLTPEGRAVAATLEPQGRPLRHKAGQFAFFGFTGAGLGEPHPFTISSGPNPDGILRVTVAPLGDLTGRVSRALAVGQTVQVEGPFGHFGAPTRKPQLWIAAGVGVTPFVALAEALSETAPPVTMIYAVRRADDAAHWADLQALAAEKSNFDVSLWESESRGRLTAEAAIQGLDGEIGARTVSFCGPAAMREALAAGFRRYGVGPRDFRYEAFEIRTGLGVRRFARWLWQRIAERTDRSARPAVGG